MNTIFFSNGQEIFAVQLERVLDSAEVEKMEWLLQAKSTGAERCSGLFVGPRREVVTPWSTNATEIVQHVGVFGVRRIERFLPVPQGEEPAFDPMLEEVYQGLSQTSLAVSQEPEPLRFIENIEEYNESAGLALSQEEVDFLKGAARSLGRPLSDAELYGFSQINSEHCRHKIFNGTFVIDGETQERSLFALIKETSKHAPEQLVSAYKDNVAFIKGPRLTLFAPQHPEQPDRFVLREIDSVLSLKAETHNFPTTVEPFNGASTGSGGEIRDRMAGGTGSIPLAGTAVYMTAYPRLAGSPAVEWEKQVPARVWKYQTPAQLLIKASNGASDFGNKFGQPLINGSVSTFEGKTSRGLYAYDRTVMLAGGVGYTDSRYAQKQQAEAGDLLVLLGGDNYRIGMAGGSVSSVDTGALSRALELSAVQRANPEMQKRVYNVIRALVEQSDNPIVMIHDHGAGGHINCFSELLDPLGGKIDVATLPVGDHTLSLKELICNESQERMGLIIKRSDLPLLQRIAEREQAPHYVVGEVTGDQRLVFEAPSGEKPIDLPLELLFGSSPRTVLEDSSAETERRSLEFSIQDGAALLERLKLVLSLEGVACKDWLTNKVDRSVTGLVAQQQTVGPLQLPLCDYGVMALDFVGTAGVGTALGHASIPGLLDEEAGAVLSVAEALTNLVWAPLGPEGIESVVLSANWMWPAKQPGEDARLYRAVRALSEFSQALGIAVPTGKDSLSMTMKYEDGTVVRAPGTVVVTAVAAVEDVRGGITPDLKQVPDTALLYLNFGSGRANPLGGSSFAQTLGQLGDKVPSVEPERFKKAFTFVQQLVKEKKILAGHDVSAGGLLTAVSEMCFAGDVGAEIAISGSSTDLIAALFSEKPGVVVQVNRGDVQAVLKQAEQLGLEAVKLGEVRGTQLKLQAGDFSFAASVAELRRVWFKPSFLLDSRQTAPQLAKERYERFDAHPLRYTMPAGFTGRAADLGVRLGRRGASGPVAAIVRDKGTNGDRELAFCLHAAGFDVKDVTMHDVMNGRESFDGISLLAFPGGFSHSDVLGAGRGWAGVFRYNERAMQELRRFYERPDTLSIGVCNGCQLLVALDAIYPEHQQKMQMRHNESGKFESCFVNVRVEETQSVMLKPLVGAELGIWVAHGEGRFSLPEGPDAYDIPLRYSSADYPANPNGSDFNAAAVCSRNGRHLAIMPHLERSTLAWSWPYRGSVPEFEVSPWMLAFTAARDWVQQQAGA